MKALIFPKLNRLKRSSVHSWPFQLELQFPKGLYGFEQFNQFHLIGIKKEQPFLRLVAKKDQTIGFVLMDPFLACPLYSPKLTRLNLAAVGVLHEAKLFLLAMVNITQQGLAMNLASPLLINWSKRVGQQILLKDEENEYFFYKR